MDGSLLYAASGSAAAGTPLQHMSRTPALVALAGSAACVVAVLLAAAVWVATNPRGCKCAEPLAFGSLCCQNLLDVVASLIFLSYGLWLMAEHGAHRDVLVPLFSIAATFSALVLLSALGARSRKYHFLLVFSSAIGVALAGLEATVAGYCLVRKERVMGWLLDIERDAQESGAVPATVSEHFESDHRQVAAVLFVLASLQLLRVTCQCIIECHYIRKEREALSHAQHGPSDSFYVSGIDASLLLGSPESSPFRRFGGRAATSDYEACVTSYVLFHVA